MSCSHSRRSGIRYQVSVRFLHGVSALGSVTLPSGARDHVKAADVVLKGLSRSESSRHELSWTGLAVGRSQLSLTIVTDRPTPITAQAGGLVLKRSLFGDLAGLRCHVQRVLRRGWHVQPDFMVMRFVCSSHGMLFAYIALFQSPFGELHSHGRGVPQKIWGRCCTCASATRMAGTRWILHIFTPLSCVILPSGALDRVKAADVVLEGLNQSESSERGLCWTLCLQVTSRVRFVQTVADVEGSLNIAISRCATCTTQSGAGHVE